MIRNCEDRQNLRDPDAFEIVKILEERITVGTYQPGRWLPTERSLCVEFDVNRATVRAVLAELSVRGLIVREPGKRPWVSENKGEISPGIKTGVEIRTITAILPQRRHPSSQEILQGVSSVLHNYNHPYRLSIMDNYHGQGPLKPLLEKNALERVFEEKNSGVILWPMMGNEVVVPVEKLHSAGIPVVFVDRYPQQMECDFVGIDNRGGAREAVRHLLDLGHRNIGFLTDSQDITTVRERLAGYLDELRMDGIPIKNELIYQNLEFGYKDIAPAVDYYTSMITPPTAILTLHDFMAYQFIHEYELRGYSVPQDMSIISFDDIDRFSSRTPMLTTMRQPFDQIGERAAELLIQRINEKPSKDVKSVQHLLLSPSLQVRNTCREL